ncbi:polyribonucleotide nucleotidyltransferase [Christensenella timonensis]|uniref:polyribonucleotide nucleotidyltransferase n=1 Tax=Christensenella timonensis TaxID=1816678 RepID=UPI00082BC351|nr:polyribonucleotide nucleotidyltransferase [Christensenella timonensis]
MQQNHVYEMELGGRTLTVESGKYAFQADGEVIVRCGDTAVLVTATASKTQREGIDFFPLSVEFEEKMYSVGKIPGGFIKREGRPSEKAILAARLIDRPIRPLFPKGYRNDVQIIATVMSVDTDIPPEAFAMIGSSAALSISGLPFAGPTGTVVVGLVDGEYVINPDSEQREKSRLHLTVSGTKDAVMMVEAGANEITEEEMLGAILFGHEEIKRICAFIEDIKNDIGKPEKEVEIHQIPDELNEAVRAYAADKVVWSVDTFDRTERETRQDQVKQEVIEHFAEEYPDSAADVADVLYYMTKEVIRGKIVNDETRPDGRKYEDIRPIWCETGIFARTHGSAVFTRGLTQAMNIVTLGGMREGQNLDGISEEDFKRYMHHYNMPPYSTGEARMMRSTSRREIGHGALAARALEPVLPSEEEFPYAIRSVSEVISSNGSTSQASVCASCLALMDAGVPIKAPVAGCAMGLIKDEENGKIVVLTDIQGLEDFLGDMDFKVAGTAKGITAIQMDIKIKGIDKEILERALAQALRGRLFILDKMTEVMPAPKDHLSPYAPKIIRFTIDPDKIREVIGSGGKVINKIIEDTGVKIDIEDDGSVSILTPDDEAASKARKIIETIVKDVKVGEVFNGKVTRIMNFGAFVELAPGKEGMCRISNLSNEFVKKVEDVCNIGDELLVKVIEIDKQGRINLTHKGVKAEDQQ